MPFPGRRYHNSVEVIALEHLQKGFVAFRIGLGQRFPFFPEQLIGPGNAVRINVADGRNDDIVAVERLLNVAAAPRANANEAQPDRRGSGFRTG
jgi:hypothetical protein